MRTNPTTRNYSGYYRLAESYRNHHDRVCHRTILNAGYLDELSIDQLNMIQKILTAKVANYDKPLFKLPYTDDTTAIRYVDEFYLCVSRSSLKRYNIEAGATTVSVTDNRKQKIELCRVKYSNITDYYLKVESHSKELKER